MTSDQMIHISPVPIPNRNRGKVCGSCRGKAPQTGFSGGHRLLWLDRKGMSRALVILGLATGLGARASAGDKASVRPAAKAKAPAPAPKPVAVTLTWAMAERFGPGYDRNRDGRPDLPNSYEYVNPDGYEVQLTASFETVGVAAADTSCAWTINGPDGSIALEAAGASPVVRLPQIGAVDPLRLLAAFSTRQDWSRAEGADALALVDPAALSWLNSLKPDARRGALARDVSLIYDVAEATEAGLAEARKQLERVSRAIASEPILARAEVCLLEYPDPTGDGDSAIARAILNDLVPGLSHGTRRGRDLFEESLEISRQTILVWGHAIPTPSRPAVRPAHQ